MSPSALAGARGVVEVALGAVVADAVGGGWVADGTGVAVRVGVGECEGREVEVMVAVGSSGGLRVDVAVAVGKSVNMGVVDGVGVRV